MKVISLSILGLVSFAPLSTRAQGAPADFNAVVVDVVNHMPNGGGYSAADGSTERLIASTSIDPIGLITVHAETVAPTYCSGSTYLVFLRVLAQLQKSGALTLDHALAEKAIFHALPDGHGAWGRWNANGPGTARFFYETGLGHNTNDISKARPGDFMKIFWNDHVGKQEHGHSVIFLGREAKGGDEVIHYWSSNSPDGMGPHETTASKVHHAIFSRLDAPERMSQLNTIPEVDPYLSSLLTTDSDFAEADAKSGIN